MKLLIAGGGTGGHLFPAIAVAEEFKRRSEDNEVLFIGNRKGIEGKVLPEEGWSVRYVLSGGVKGGGLTGMIKGVFKSFCGTLQSVVIILGFRPRAILGMGGYTSAPALLAGRLMGIRAAIHEQNAIPGMTNRMLGRIVNKIFLTYPDSERFFPPAKVRMTGNPVREALLESAVDAEGAAVKKEKITLFIFGGSRGARRLNEVVLEALTGTGMKEFGSIRVIHQTGSDDLESVKEGYEEAGIDAEVQSFIKDMARAYREADLVICRAGAMTISELLVMGKPSILIPYPYAADNHQEVNARAIAKEGAAKMILEKELDAQVLTDAIGEMISDRSRLSEMGRRGREISKRDAAAIICDEIRRMAA